MRRLAACVLALAAVGCKATIPSGVYPCTTIGDCPPGQVCAGTVCVWPEAGVPNAGPDAASEDASMTPDGGQDAGQAGDAGTLDASGGSDAGVDGGSCTDYRLTASADTTLLPGGSCDGTVFYGAFEFGNIGAGAGLFRFDLPPELATALTDAPPASATLELHRNFACLGSGMTCPAAAGQLCAAPARSDWDEGMEMGNLSGAEWCRRSGGSSPIHWTDCDAPSGSGCGAAPPNALGATSCQAVTDTQPSVRIDLAPASVQQGILQFGSARLSLRVSRADGATFVAATREDTDPSEPAASLEILVCP